MGFIVALLLALTVPVSQLRTVMIEKTCCCPDPAKCRCPDHGKAQSDQPQLKACHQETHAHVAPVLPAFAPPSASPAPVIPVTVALVDHVLRRPHAAPPPLRPDAPS